MGVTRFYFQERSSTLLSSLSTDPGRVRERLLETRQDQADYLPRAIRSWIAVKKGREV